MGDGRYKLEFVDLPNSEPEWFDSKEDLDATVAFLKSCPCDDGEVHLRITEYGAMKVEEI